VRDSLSQEHSVVLISLLNHLSKAATAPTNGAPKTYCSKQ